MLCWRLYPRYVSLVGLLVVGACGRSPLDLDALGVATGDDPEFEPPPPRPSASGILELAAGHDFACALTDRGTVHCWGCGRFGQMGNATLVETNPTPQTVVELDGGDLDDAVRIGAGEFHVCLARSSGAAACWGHSIRGSLGNGGDQDVSTPVEVVGLSAGVIDITGGPGYHHTCASLDDGTLWCWGDNALGQLGDGTVEDAWSPRLVVDLGGVQSFAVGYIHTCAAGDDGQASCWGWNAHGVVDASSSSDAFNTPQAKADLDDVVQLAGGNHHACARHADGRVSCWGYEGNGQLGDGSGDGHGDPRSVLGLDDAVDLAGGKTHNCAVNDSGSVVCWGDNHAGQLGDGTTEHRPTPVAAVGVHDALQVVVGTGFTCALSYAQGPVCWGRNSDGQLGNGTTEDSLMPVPVAFPT